MWRSVVVAVVAACVIVCTESTSTVTGTNGPDATASARVALRLYGSDGTQYVLQDKTASITRLVMVCADGWKNDTVYVPVGNACRLTQYDNTSTGIDATERYFTAFGDTTIRW